MPSAVPPRTVLGVRRRSSLEAKLATRGRDVSVTRHILEGEPSLKHSLRRSAAIAASLVQLTLVSPAMLLAEGSAAEAQGYKLGFGCGVVLGILIFLWLLRALFRFVVGLFRR